MEIKPGDVVQLKSGGPEMTVRDLEDYRPFGDGSVTQAYCQWFMSGKIIRDAFSLNSLQKIDRPSK